MNPRTLLVCGAIASSTLISAAAAETEIGLIPGTISANVTLATDYTFRGISQTDEEPAIQGGFDYEVETGLLGTSAYLGIWASNVDFNDGDEASIEVDLYGGFAGAVAGIGWDVGFIYYAYPGAASSLDYDFWEVTTGLSYSPLDRVEVGVRYNYSPDYFGGSGAGHFVEGALSVDLPLPEPMATRGLGLSLDGSIGHQWIGGNDTFGTPDYLTWSIGASLSYKFLSLGVAYVDTDLSKSECFGRTDLCGARAIGTLTASF
ncbi:MAG: hypothetical protein EA405_01540 [Rhodospirillales bacterium]|nr:MAG: hypothetical protein EA405_01540 [Rhodospirillales bacterium]